MGEPPADEKDCKEEEPESVEDLIKSDEEEDLFEIKVEDPGKQDCMKVTAEEVKCQLGISGGLLIKPDLEETFKGKHPGLIEGEMSNPDRTKIRQEDLQFEKKRRNLKLKDEWKLTNVASRRVDQNRGNPEVKDCRDERSSEIKSSRNLQDVDNIDNKVETIPIIPSHGTDSKEEKRQEQEKENVGYIDEMTGILDFINQQSSENKDIGSLETVMERKYLEENENEGEQTNEKIKEAPYRTESGT